jgi:hypothetical protein
MIVDINGTAVCSRCGAELGTGPITLCVIVSDLGDDGRVVTHHFCRLPRSGAPNGCAGLMMTTKSLEFFNASKEIEPVQPVDVEPLAGAAPQRTVGTSKGKKARGK